jgi:hypothetical protein
MAERLAAIPPLGRRTSQYARYADGQVWLLRLGEDVRSTGVHSATVGMHQHAKRIGKIAKVRKLSETELAVQFLPKGAQ